MTANRHLTLRTGAPFALFALALTASAVWAATFSELVLRGFEELRSQRFEQAAESFDSALDLEPTSEPARKGLASAWAGLGLSHLRAGRLTQSREYLEKAVETRPESAEYHLLLAQVVFKSADTRAARREIDLALDLAPDSAPARELSGDLYDREGRLNLAVEEWETASKSAASHTLAEKIARGRREMDAEAGMQRESSRYFVVLYEREVPRELVRSFFKALDQAFDTLHDRLGEYPRDPITVLLYAKADFTSVTRAPDWAGGLYDGKIRVPVGGLTSIEEAVGLHSVLVHEMTHAFLFRMAPVGLPRWFHEGLAKAVEGWDPAKVRAWLSEHSPGGFTTLDDVDRGLVGRGGDVTTAYMVARLAIGDLEEIRGFGAIRRIIAGVGAGGAFEEVFRDEARLEIAEFEERWRRGLP